VSTQRRSSNRHCKSAVELVKGYFGQRKLSAVYGFSVESVRARYAEQAYFTVSLVNRSGRISSEPVYSGLYSAGRPSQGIFGWVDGDYFDEASFPDSTGISLSEHLLAVPFFKILGGLVPAGGSLMVSYSMFGKESELHRETKRALDRGYPPAATPLGFLLFKAGCGIGFKDWYFAEGGREGPEKLQGHKPLNDQQAHLKAQELLNQLRSFMAQQRHDDELWARCSGLAREVVEELEGFLRTSDRGGLG